MPRRGRQRVAKAEYKAALERLEVWTPLQASAWSAIPYRQLLRLMQAGTAPCIVGAPARPTSSDRRVYLIPRVPFQRWLESIGSTTINTGTGTDATAA